MSLTFLSASSKSSSSSIISSAPIRVLAPKSRFGSGDGDREGTKEFSYLLHCDWLKFFADLSVVVHLET